MSDRRLTTAVFGSRATAIDAPPSRTKGAVAALIALESGID